MSVGVVPTNLKVWLVWKPDGENLLIYRTLASAQKACTRNSFIEEYLQDSGSERLRQICIWRPTKHGEFIRDE